MMERRTFILVGAAGFCSLVSGCDSLIGVTYRYRLTVEVDSPQGMRRGSSVDEVTAWEGIAIPGPEAGGFHARFRGEAVAVDLPGKQTLFILLDNVEYLLLSSYKPYLPRISDPYDRMRAAKKLRVVATVPPSIDGGVNLYPRFVRFHNLNDPKSVELVDPDNLAASFGEGVRLRRLTVQATDDGISNTIGKRLPWLTKYADINFAGKSTVSNGRDLLQNLGLGSFSTELRR